MEARAVCFLLNLSRMNLYYLVADASSDSSQIRQAFQGHLAQVHPYGHGIFAWSDKPLDELTQTNTTIAVVPIDSTRFAQVRTLPQGLREFVMRGAIRAA
jgi:hypothetical protein